MPQEERNIRRRRLRAEEPLFRQQSPYLRQMGCGKARLADDGETADALRDLDLLAWGETSRWLARFAAAGPEYAPCEVGDLLAETAALGRPLGMEASLPPLVAALTFVRFMAGGDEVYEKRKPIWMAILRSQDTDPQARPLFLGFCREFEANKLDPSTGEETVYRRGDPMERPGDTGEEKAEAVTEALLGRVLEATGGWNTGDAFAACWPQWTGLWRHLLEQDGLAEALSRKCPRSRENLTDINIRLVCQVGGMLARHLESLGRTAWGDGGCTRLAGLVKDAWPSDSCRKEIGRVTELTGEQARLVSGWLAANVTG